MNTLKTKLDCLCIFRQLLGDPVITALRQYLENPTCSGYAAFTAALYEANGGDLAAHIRSLCESNENIYVRTIGRGMPAGAHLKAALDSELDTLQELSALTPESLRAPLDYSGFLPGFIPGSTDIRTAYLHRIGDIGRFGYGIYAGNRMFLIDDTDAIVPVQHPDPIALSDLVDYERERQIILDNTKALLAGKPAANILLSGDAGTGKSSTVKAVGNALFAEGLRIIEVRKDQLRAIPKILDELSVNPLKFVLFIDDLSFLGDDDSYNALKAVLEGSVTAKSSNVVIYATSNRRHIIRETFSDREGDEVHRNDTMQEMVSLSERFGLHVTFSKPNKATFLHIVHHLAEESGITLPESELDLLAERFALERGGRSARLARQFIDGLLATGDTE